MRTLTKNPKNTHKFKIRKILKYRIADDGWREEIISEIESCKNVSGYWRCQGGVLCNFNRIKKNIPKGNIFFKLRIIKESKNPYKEEDRIAPSKLISYYLNNEPFCSQECLSRGLKHHLKKNYSFGDWKNYGS